MVDEKNPNSVLTLENQVAILVCEANLMPDSQQQTIYVDPRVKEMVMVAEMRKALKMVCLLCRVAITSLFAG